MSLPGNGIFVVRGEMSTLITAMKRGSRWSSSTFMDEEKDGLMKLFVDLKQVLNRLDDLRLIDPNVFLTPFLEVIRTDETTGAITSLALASINKFLSYGLIDPTSQNLAATVENIVDAVTHARFMGTDQSSDGVTLFRVVEVLHTLMRGPEGSALTNEAVCEIMLSCFKICFEPRLNELLRRSAEQALKDMVLLLFMRLPQFSEEHRDSTLLKKFQMMAASMEKDKKQRKKSQVKAPAIQSGEAKSDDTKLAVPQGSSDPHSPATPLESGHLKVPPLATTPATPAGNILDMQGKITQTPTTALGCPADAGAEPPSEEVTDSTSLIVPEVPATAAEQAPPSADQQAGGGPAEENSEYVNSVGVRFTQQNSEDESSGLTPLLPYGLPCVQELLRFLILLCNPTDKQNTDTMIHMGLSLLTVAFEVGADNIGKYDTLLDLVKDDLCRNLIALLNCERLTIFAADLQVCFLMFESLRGHLKFQLEAYLKKLGDLISSDNPKTPYEMRELALDNILQMWRIPGFVAELYVNYDCDLYCSDLFESLTKMLSKYTLSATNSVYSTHILSMETLISVIESIERNCVAAKNNQLVTSSAACGKSAASLANRHSRNNSGVEGIIIESPASHAKSSATGGVDDSKEDVENISKFLNSSHRLNAASHNRVAAGAPVTREHLANVKEKKRLLSQGTELFNQRPDKGIQYLQENGILKAELDPREIALFLRENPGLDKKMIGEYISKKKNVESQILMNFVESFEFSGLRVDQALRLYLETFRLPGEAPLIFLVMEHFADHWHKQNGEPFANTDAAFRLAYAIIMLNMDQHNSNAKRLNVPMTQDDFRKNLRGLNGGADFDQDMLLNVFNAIKNEEIVMPAEQTGLVRENYLWKVLLRRSAGSDGAFSYMPDSTYDIELFNMVWGASLSALSFMYDKSSENGFQRTLAGFRMCAAISAHYNLHDDFDALMLTLSKFTTLLNSAQQEVTGQPQSEIVQSVNFGLNPKAQASIRTVFALVHDYGDCLRDSWKNILDLMLQLFRLKLLPKALIEVEDFCETNGKAQLILEKPSQKQEAGLFSSLYSYLSSEGQREPSYEEQEFIKIGKKCIKECQIDQMIQESKFVQLESLQELIKDLLALVKAPTSHKATGIPYAEDVVVFWMEMLVKIVVQNRDRMIHLWPGVRDQMYLLLLGSATHGYDYLLNRSIVAVLKLAIYLMRNEELCPIVLQSLKMLLLLKPETILRISKQISMGIYELLKTSAQNIHSEQDWQIIFTILECVGAGAVLPEFDQSTLPAALFSGAKSDGALSSEEDSGLPDRGYNSDSEVASNTNPDKAALLQAAKPTASPTAENWILVNKETDLGMMSRPQSPPAQSSLVYNCKLAEHSPFALFKCWDSLSFIVRNVAHITPYNFESCVRCIRTFVEACRDGGIHQRHVFAADAVGGGKKKGSSKRPEGHRKGGTAQEGGRGGGGAADSALSDSESNDLSQRYETLSIQLLDLMYTLYTRTAQIFRWWAEEDCSEPQCSALWGQGWCPLLQGIARLAMDRRREVRTYAISCLQQRALLVHDLQTLSGSEWASCFQQVLFPLLNELLPDSSSVRHIDPVLLEESRIRTATIMSKVFLHHLTPLIELGAAFNELWLEILNYIEKFMKVGSDMLSEQMQEILKNMLLVMHSVGVFHTSDGAIHMPLWELTWQRIGEFLPNLKSDLFCAQEARTQLMTEIGNTKEPPMATSQPQQPPMQQLPPQPPQPIPQQQPQLHPQQQPQLQPQQQLPLVQPPPMQQQQVAPPQTLPQPLQYPHTPSQPQTPVESPKHSIILNPPASIERHLGQTIPMLMPQFGDNFAASLLNGGAAPMLVQPLPVVSNATSPTPTPNGPSAESSPKREAGEVVQQQTEATVATAEVLTATSTTATSLSYTIDSYNIAIDLPETPPTAYVYNGQQQQHVAYSEAQTGGQESHGQAETQAYQQQQQYYHSLQQQQQQVLQQQQQVQATPEQPQYAPQIPAAPSGQLESPPAGAEPAVNVPISHLMANNAYPSLAKMPNPAIVHSFTPLYVQAQHPQPGADIYQEYVQNPYNLTLQQQPAAEQMAAPQLQQDQLMLQQQLEQQQQQHMFAAPPTNYFSGNVDPSAIPPGSEMLYGKP